MPSSVKPPDLIISLSQYKVSVRFPEQDETGKTAWESTFPIQGAFRVDQISEALDEALTQNPSLVDQFDSVEVVLMDRPNIFIPEFYRENGQLAHIAEKYLRLRVGDLLTSDSTPTNTIIAYSLPADALQIFREYYSNISHLHLTSVLWSSLSQHHESLSKSFSRLYFNLTGNTMIVLGAGGDQLIFSRIFHTREYGDFLYYSMACNRLLRPKETWNVTIRNESAAFDLPASPYYKFDHQLELPELPALIAHHRLCES